MRHVFGRLTPACPGVVMVAVLLTVVTGRAAGQADAADLKAALMAEGQAVFGAECTTCHGADGTSDVGPALAGNTSMAVTDFVIKRLLQGVADMPAFASSLTDRQIAAVGTFVRNSWENAHGVVHEADVTRVRADVARGAK